MKFGKVFDASVVPEWRQHYLQYNDLKKWIKEVKPQQSVDPEDFNREVERQVAHVMEFYEQERFILENDIASASRQRLLLERSPETRKFLMQERELCLIDMFQAGEQLRKLFSFLKLNSTALRKILKKFHKKVTSTGPELLQVVAANQHSILAMNLKKLKDFSLLQPCIDHIKDGITQLQVSLKTDMSDPALFSIDDGAGGSNGPGGWSPSPTIRFGQYKRKGAMILEDLSMMRIEMRDVNSYLSFLSSQAVIPLSPKLLRNQSKIQQLKRQGSRGGAAGFSAHVTEDVIEENQELEVLQRIDGMENDEDDVVSQYINLASTFFYLCNYNINLPTSAEYAAHLGLHPSASGVIVAMTPMAALISAVGYSYWSNYSFKAPLFVSAVFLVSGNLMYALAWDLELTSFILLGRFVSGLGGCRAVNRRYIADNISVEHRTKASAAFVAAGAMGMALGPFMASLFSEFDTVWFGITLNEMTSPAFFMAAVWVVYGLFVLLRFREPRRRPPSLDSPGLSDGEDSRDSQSNDSDELDGFTDDDYEYMDDPGVDSDREGLLEDNFEDQSNLAQRRGRFGRAKSSSTENGFNDGIDIVLDNTARGMLGSPNSSEASPEFDGYGESSRLLVRATEAREHGTAGDVVSKYGATRSGSGAALAKRQLLLAHREKRRFWLVLLSLWMIFWVKLVQEALLTASSLVLPSFYEWSAGRVGLFMGLLGISVVPFNLVVLALSRCFGLKDAFWVKFLNVPLILGAISLVSFEDAPMAPLRLMSGYLMVFITSQIMEAVIMSLFSKVISPRMAAGTWNSGFLATEAGTLGRAAGNALITLLGSGTTVQLQRSLYVFDSTVGIATMMFALSLLS
ncbi:SPX domain-containing membrane protein Os04g0573000 [Durusdinium trenchii]|uniref:SPX domain-containing membrane protein Os04g0573000 n=1 Tax=Durusdinium trenchii TaxID=1381693 RepID=A0ABP0K161_9DINO